MGDRPRQPTLISPPLVGWAYISETTLYRSAPALRLGANLRSQNPSRDAEHMWAEVLVVDCPSRPSERLLEIHNLLRHGYVKDAMRGDDGDVRVHASASVSVSINNRGRVWLGAGDDAAFILKDLYPNGPLVHYLRDGVIAMLRKRENA